MGGQPFFDEVERSHSEDDVLVELRFPLEEGTDDVGQVTELSASAEQLDLVIDALDELLGDDDDAIEVEDDVAQRR